MNLHAKFGKVREYLTPRQLIVLAAILRKTEGMPPSVRELMKETGCRSPNAISGIVNKLTRMGLIHSEIGKCRTMTALCKFIPADQLAWNPSLPTSNPPT